MAKDLEQTRREQGRRLREAREAKGFETAKDAAKHLRLDSHVSYQHHENGTRGLSRQARFYAQAFDVPAEWLLYGDNPPSWYAEKKGVPAAKPRTIPIIAWVAAGSLADVTSQIPEGTETIEISGLEPGDYFATRVSGDSMDRLSPPGSLILVNRAEREAIRGRRFIFSRRGETTYKRFESNPRRLVPESTNPMHEPIFPNSEEEWTVIGRVRMTIFDDM